MRNRKQNRQQHEGLRVQIKQASCLLPRLSALQRVVQEPLKQGPSILQQYTVCFWFVAICRISEEHHSRILPSTPTVGPVVSVAGQPPLNIAYDILHEPLCCGA